MNLIPCAIVTFTVICVYFLDKWENKHIKSIFDWVPAILLAYIIPAAICALIGHDYSGDKIHQLSKDYFIPLAIIAVMSSLSLKQLKSIGWKPIFLFISGSFWIAIFPVCTAFALFDHSLVTDIFVNQSYWKGLPPIVGSWIGGSTSQLVLKEIVECPENVFLTILILDNILVNIWTVFMFQSIKISDKVNKQLGISGVMAPSEVVQSYDKTIHPALSILSIILIVLSTNYLVDSFILKILLLSSIGLLLSNFIKSWDLSFMLKIGSILILIVMAVLGLKLKFDFFKIEIALLIFLVIWLIGHFVFMLFIAKLLNVNFAWVPIASMANVGGIATAPAVTAAYEKKWMPHAIILAILSMATGTFWGLLTIYLLKCILIN